MSKVRTRKRGKTWSYVFEAGKKEDGKRRVIEKGGFATSDEAYEAGAKAYISYRHGDVGITSERILFKDFYEIYKKRKSEEKTAHELYKFDKKFQKHVISFFGNMFVQDIKPVNVDTWIRSIAKAGYAKSTMTGLITQLRILFKFAIYPCELITANPAQYIKVPEQIGENSVKRRVISTEDLSKILEYYPPEHPYHIVVLIAYHTGMRISEILGLTWENINLETGMIFVRTQVRSRTTKLYEITPILKTKASKRDIPISKELVTALKKWQATQAIIQKVNNIAIYQDSTGLLCKMSPSLAASELNRVNLVCTSKKGSYIIKSNITASLHKLGVNAHSFRHTHATMLISAGALPKGVAARLGHADVRITQNLYAHVTDKLQRDTLTIFENMLADKKRFADKTQTKKSSKHRRSTFRA